MSGSLVERVSKIEKELNGIKTSQLMTGDDSRTYICSAEETGRTYVHSNEFVEYYCTVWFDSGATEYDEPGDWINHCGCFYFESDEEFVLYEIVDIRIWLGGQEITNWSDYFVYNRTAMAKTGDGMTVYLERVRLDYPWFLWIIPNQGVRFADNLPIRYQVSVRSSKPGKVVIADKFIWE